MDQHIELAVNIFKKIWSDDTLDINIRLFVAYIVEERMRTFGDRWMAEGEIENIRQWESKNTLDSTLSNNYGSCLEFLFKMSLYMQAVGQAMEIRESILYSLLYRSSFLIVPIRLWRNYKKSKMPII